MRNGKNYMPKVIRCCALDILLSTYVCVVVAKLPQEFCVSFESKISV